MSRPHLSIASSKARPFWRTANARDVCESWTRPTSRSLLKNWCLFLNTPVLHPNLAVSICFFSQHTCQVAIWPSRELSCVCTHGNTSTYPYPVKPCFKKLQRLSVSFCGWDLEYLSHSCLNNPKPLALSPFSTSDRKCACEISSKDSAGTQP